MEQNVLRDQLFLVMSLLHVLGLLVACRSASMDVGAMCQWMSGMQSDAVLRISVCNNRHDE
jgi:hypothetical protein